MSINSILLLRRWVTREEAAVLFQVLGLITSSEFYMGKVGDFSPVGGNWSLIAWINADVSPHVPARLPVNGVSAVVELEASDVSE
jgi:hypothetical protein